VNSMKKAGVYLWMVVIAQALLLLFVVSALSRRPRGEEGQTKRAFADVRGGIKTMLEMFKQDCGRFPTGEEGLKVLFEPPKDGSLTGWRGPYVDPPGIPTDPWGYEYVYRFPGVNNTNGYDLYSRGPDGVGNTGDDIGNWNVPVSAPVTTTVYSETLSERIFRGFFFWPLVVPVLFAGRLVAEVLSKRVGVLMSENPVADCIWMWIAVTSVFIWLFMFPRLAGR